MPPPPKEHSIVARLSMNEEGKPQIVTTNFDLLFEHPGVTSGIPVFEPPIRIDLFEDERISGITYLHGRLQAGDSASHHYVLGSADFSRAYMIDGWATKFLRHLFENYTVVLLGYQAKDPLMEYLLRGLGAAAELDPLRFSRLPETIQKTCMRNGTPFR